MIKDNQPLIEFHPKLPRLSKSEQSVLKLLIEAGKLIAPIYLEQEKQANGEINRKEIEEVAKDNSAILSPYTVVEKVDGKLVATPYHVKYAEFLKPIVEKLEKAAGITDNKEFGNALRIQAKALLTGSYDQATAAWIKIKPYILDISIGPLHHFDDQLSFSKASYHAWVGVVDTEGTDRLNNYKSITLSARRKALVPKERIDPDKIRAKVLNVVLFSGVMARTKFTGMNLPIDVNIVEKYGAEVTLFNQPNDLRVKEQILPTFNKIFSKGFRQGFSEEDLRRGYQHCVALHELAHSYLYYKNSVRNLQDFFPSIYELAATILGLRMAGPLLLQDRITNKQLESMIVAYTCRSFYLMEGGKGSRFLMNYALGGKVFINFMIESGAFKRFDDLININFTKTFVSLHELSYILEGLLSQGTRKEAEVFVEKYTH